MTALTVLEIDTIPVHAGSATRLVQLSCQTGRLVKWPNFQEIVHETVDKSQRKLTVFVSPKRPKRHLGTQISDKGVGVLSLT